MEVDELPPVSYGNRQRPSPYDALYADILLRLEQTQPHRMLRYDFADEKELRNMSRTLYGWFKRRYGAGYIRISLRTTALYIMRGDRWYKP